MAPGWAIYQRMAHFPDDRHKSERNRSALIMLVALCVCGFLLSLFLILNYLNDRERIIEEARGHCANEVDRASKKINKEMSAIKPVSENIARDLSNGVLTKENLVERLYWELENHPNIFGIGVAYVPWVGDPRFRKISPYYVTRTGDRNIRNYDIIQLFTTSFHSIDLKTGEKVTNGVVFIDYRLDSLGQLITSLDLGQAGYGYILDQEGVFVYHPISDYVDSHKSIFELAQEIDNERLRDMGEKAIQGQSGVIDHENEITGESSWYFYEHIQATSWSLGIVYIKNELSEDISTLRIRLVWVSLAVVLFMIPFAALVVGAHKGTQSSLWKVSITASICFMVVIGFIWYLTLTEKTGIKTQDAIIVDRASLNRYLDKQASKLGAAQSNLLRFIPTGVYIQTITLDKPNEVALSGYIWQRYFDGLHDEISRGFVFPDSLQVKLVEAYRRRDEDDQSEIIGWFFETRLMQHYEYSKYPFDTKTVKLQLRHKDFDKFVVLEPELDSYEIMNSASKPGVRENLTMSDWSITGSFFSYVLDSINTDFGVNEHGTRNDFPELCFNISAKRKFQNPFITNMLPLISVAILLFSVLMIISKRSETLKILGSGTARVLSTCAAFFFVVAFYQTELRSKLAVQEIIYLEYFYFAIYLAILAVSVDAILFALSKISIVQFKDNFLAKLFFWPILLGFLLVVTIMKLCLGY